MTNQLDQSGVGSLDWAGSTAPAGGSHTGQATITMIDGAVFVVAHNKAEVDRKVRQPTPGNIVAFDSTGRAGNVPLNVANIKKVT